MRKSLSLLAILVIASLPACESHDADYYPYMMIAIDSYVYDNRTNREYFAGRVEGNYTDRKEMAAACGDYAYSEARNRNLDDWSYICCTVTNDSECATKVR